MLLIGMRVNRWWRVDLWLPTFLAMPRMLAELERNPVAAGRGEAEHFGYLGARTLFGAGGPSGAASGVDDDRVADLDEAEQGGDPVEVADVDAPVGGTVVAQRGEVR